MIRPAPLTFVNYPFHHHSKLLRKFRALVTAVGSGLQLKKNGEFFGEKEKMVNCKQSGSVSSAFLG